MTLSLKAMLSLFLVNTFHKKTMIKISFQDNVQRYQQRLNHLYDNIKKWVEGEEFIVTTFSVEIFEEGEHYVAPALRVQTMGGKILASLKPQGASIVLAEGLVEVENWWENEHLIYLPAGGPQIRDDCGTQQLIYEGIEQEGWYWDRLNTCPHFLNKTVFLELLSWVE